MLSLIGFLFIVLCVILIIGLIKPSFVLRWSSNPSRQSVFVYFILATLLVGILGLLIPDREISKTDIELAEQYIKEENYSFAKVRLQSIEEKSEFYTQAQSLLQNLDSIEALQKEEDRIARELTIAKEVEFQKTKLKEQLERELNSFDEGIDFSSYRGTIDALQLELALFTTWANLVIDGEHSNDKEIQLMAKKLRQKLIKIQLKEFPLIRKEYTKLVASIMWDNDIEVTVSGSGNQYINFTGGLFAANKNKKDFHNEVSNVLKIYRFGQARYRWYSGEDQYTYWKIFEGKDSDLVRFNK